MSNSGVNFSSGTDKDVETSFDYISEIIIIKDADNMSVVGDIVIFLSIFRF